MILSKDLQEIIEGVHYFLSETLSHEPLPGKVECLRRGLVLQLEALAISYPSLRIRPRSSVSMPYLAMDQGPNQVVMHRLSESLSSASSNSYSNSSSGDGLVMGSGRGGCEDQQMISDNQITQDEEYEDFQDSNDLKIPDPNGLLKDGDATQDDLDEDPYMETLDAVSFSTAIASCDKHGVLAKKTKGLLRNMKNYHCVSTNGMLYLYLKETDERQRKTIDLTGYIARIATGEDIRDQRKKDSAFEIVAPGKKTHTFIARTARDRIEWLNALARTIRGGRSRTLPPMGSLSSIFSGISSNGSTLMHTPKTPIIQTLLTDNRKSSAEDIYYHDVADDDKDEVYEVVGPEGTVFGKPVGVPENMPLRPAPHPPGLPEDLQDYDPVSPEDVPPPLPECPPPSTPKCGKRPPERPPLPANMQNRLNQQAARPLPDAPKDVNYNSYDPGGIYCEIEEDMFENDDDNGSESTSEYKNFSGDTNYANRNNLVQDSKKPRAVSADGLPQDSGSLSPLSSRASTNSLVGSFSDEILMNMNISDPNLSQHTPHKYSIRRQSYKTPPKLPPKGVPLPTVDDDDSEYKVPPSAIMDVEYQIPPNPVPTESETEGTPSEASCSLPCASSEFYKVPSSQNVVQVKQIENSNRNSVIEDQSISSIKSVCNDKEKESQHKSNLKSLANKFEKKDSFTSKDFKDSKLSGQGTSVKDMIARLNKNKSQAEQNGNKSKETSTTDKTDSTSTKPSESSDIKVVKPNLPPRPQNLMNKATVNRNSSSGTEDQKHTTSDKATESDDDYYETPEGNSFDTSFQEDDVDGSKNDATVSSRSQADSINEVSASATGEWYIAKFAFVATIDQALSFNRGDQIYVHEINANSGWWKATVKGRFGVVPKEYLKKKES